MNVGGSVGVGVGGEGERNECGSSASIEDALVRVDDCAGA